MQLFQRNRSPSSGLFFVLQTPLRCDFLRLQKGEFPMKFRILAAVAACALASSCQTSANQGQKQWVQIQAGDVFDVASAKCNLYAQQFQQGMYAQGTAGFVIGAQLGNALGNAIRIHEAYTQCMTISGWKQVPIVKPKPVVRKATYKKAQ